MRPITVVSNDEYWRINDDLSRYFYRKLCHGIFSMYLDAPTYLHMYLTHHEGLLYKLA